MPGIGWPNIGAARLLTAGGVGEYASFPWAWPRGDLPTHPVPTGTTLVGWRNWNGSDTATHSTGGAAWLSRNGVAAVKVFDAASEGAQVQDVFPVMHSFDTDTWWMYVRLYKDTATVNYTLRYTTSTDDGQTWAATQLLPTLEGYLTTETSAFMSFLPSDDGTKTFATTFGRESGQSVNSAAIHETTDGVTWTLRCWLRRGSQGGGDEAGICRLPNPDNATHARIVGAIRPVQNGDEGFSYFTDDEFATVTVQSAQSGFKMAGGAQCYPLTSKRWYCIGRSLVNTNMNNCLAWWLFDQDALIKQGYAEICPNYDSSDGGYSSLGMRSNGTRFLVYYTDRGIPGHRTVICESPLSNVLVGQ